MPTNMNAAFPPMPFPISTSSTTIPSSTKDTSTSKSSTTSMSKTTGTDNNVTNTMKKKNTQIMELSDEEEEEEESEEKNMNITEDDSKVNNIKRQYKILTDSFHDMETVEANFCQFSIGKRS